MMKTLLAAAFLALAALPASAHDYKAGALTLDHPWLRMNVPGRPSAGYVALSNAGDSADKLVSASSPAFGRVELHNHIMEDGAMKMRPVEAVEVPAGDSIALAPGGYHLMMFDAKQRMEPGEMIPLTLVFEKAGAVEVELQVYGLGKSPESSGHGEMKMEGGMDHSDHETSAQ